MLCFVQGAPAGTAFVLIYSHPPVFSTIDFVLIDLKGASKDQIQAMMAYVKSLPLAQQNNVRWIRP